LQDPGLVAVARLQTVLVAQLQAERFVLLNLKTGMAGVETEVESLLANGSGQKFISRDYHTTGADLHYSLKTLCRRNFYVAFGTFVGI
jgi:hypothetical protein